MCYVELINQPKFMKTEFNLEPSFVKRREGYDALACWYIHTNLRANIKEMVKSFKRFEVLTSHSEPTVFAFQVYHRDNANSDGLVDGKWYITPDGEELDRDNLLIVLIRCGYYVKDWKVTEEIRSPKGIVGTAPIRVVIKKYDSKH